MKPLFMKKKKQREVDAAYREMKDLPTFAIVQTIDKMIGILRNRGVAVTDWDDRRKDVHGMRLYGNTAFILAPLKHQETGGENSEQEK